MQNILPVYIHDRELLVINIEGPDPAAVMHDTIRECTSLYRIIVAAVGKGKVPVTVLLRAVFRNSPGEMPPAVIR